MALDIRLDFINNIEPAFVEQMTRLRQVYIGMDEALMLIADQAAETSNQAAARSIALARTNLEIALQYTIKSLCLLGEIK